jgi:hypothetical protein
MRTGSPGPLDESGVRELVSGVGGRTWTKGLKSLDACRSVSRGDKLSDRQPTGDLGKALDCSPQGCYLSSVHSTKILGAFVATIATEIMPAGASISHDENVEALAFRSGELMMGVITADSLRALRILPKDTFHAVVTSPPYYWARDYGVEGQIGHEDSVEEYVARLTEVFEEVRRVLHPEGVFYLNIGDTYYSGNGQPHGRDPRSPSRNFMRRKFRAVDKSGWDIPKKSLIGIPWRVAFSLQNRGWTLRSDIIWNRVTHSLSQPRSTAPIANMNTYSYSRNRDFIPSIEQH